MSSRAYVGSAARNFRQALVNLIKSEYGILNSDRVLELLAGDICKLVEQFYPQPGRVGNGWMVFTGTRAEGAKAYPGQRAGDHELVTLAWPILLPEDLQYLAEHPETKPTKRILLKKRIARIIEHGLSHPDGPVLLTLSDLAAMLNQDTVQISKLLKEARLEMGKELPTKGYYFDQGMRPTHKDEIIALYESGMDEADIARYSHHAQGSVGHYLQDYESVKLLFKYKVPVEVMSQVCSLQSNVIQAYAKLVAKYHPELLPPSEQGLTAEKD
jgi:hypothetical protein